jgi:hypothetical protein
MSADGPTIIDFESYLNRSEPIEDGDYPKVWSLDQCKHMQVRLDRESHTVTCKECDKQLDPFWYLQLLAREWRTRAYVDVRAKESAAELRQARLNAEARGKYFEQPEKGVGREAWEVFSQLWGKDFRYMYRSGSEWMGAHRDHTAISLHYARGVLAGAYEDSWRQGEAGGAA